VDLENGKLSVRYALHRVNPRSDDSASAGTKVGEPKRRDPAEIHLTEPKTRKSRRTLDLRQGQASGRKLCGSRWQAPKVHCEGRIEEVDDFIFTTSIGTPLDGCNVTKRFQKILEDAKIPRHRFHDLRHTLLAVQGVHPKAIQGVLGWDQASMLDRYSHFVDAMRKDAAEKMDAILNPLDVKLAVKQPVRRL
jgi:integrase